MYVCLHTCINTCKDPCMSITYIHAHTHIFIHMSQRGVLRTIKSFVHALGTSSSMTEPTINLTLLTFIEQVNIYDLQIFRRWSYSLPYILYPLWVIPTWFIPCIIKTKYSIIPSYNMHFNIN